MIHRSSSFLRKLTQQYFQLRSDTSKLLFAQETHAAVLSVEIWYIEALLCLGNSRSSILISRDLIHRSSSFLKKLTHQYLLSKKFDTSKLFFASRNFTQQYFQLEIWYIEALLSSGNSRSSTFSRDLIHRSCSLLLGNSRSSTFGRDLIHRSCFFS